MKLLESFWSIRTLEIFEGDQANKDWLDRWDTLSSEEQNKAINLYSTVIAGWVQTDPGLQKSILMFLRKASAYKAGASFDMGSGANNTPLEPSQSKALARMTNVMSDEQLLSLYKQIKTL